MNFPIDEKTRQITMTEEQAHEIARRAYQIQFDKETELRRLRLLDYRDGIRDPGEPVLQILEPTASKLRVFQLLKEIRKQVLWLDEEIRVQKLINMDANISAEIVSYAEEIGVDFNA
jgi:hypothetical protein